MNTTIHAERDSVCMGDDVTAPNEAELEVRGDMQLSGWLRTVADYVPEMEDVIWSVHEKNRAGRVLALLHFDANRTCSIDLQVQDIPMQRANFDAIFCAYFYRDMLGLKAIGGKLTFAEKVLAYLRQSR